VRVAALRALDGIGDPRTLDPAIRALGDEDPDVAVAAIGVLRGWLTQEPGTRALDALAAAALDRAREPRVRLAALDALAELPREIVQPVLDQGARDTPRPAATIDDAAAAHEWLAQASRAPLSELHDLVVVSRERAGSEPAAAIRARWLNVRAAAHAALARRGSRVALYDLREAFDAATEPLALDYLTAVAAIGDATCLEPMARAWAASRDAWWRDHLATAAADIMHRTRLSGRSAVVKRIRTKFPGFL
jgi:HEAT repeat protein